MDHPEFKSGIHNSIPRRVFAGLLIVFFAYLCGWQTCRLQRPLHSGRLNLMDWLENPKQPTVNLNREEQVDEINAFGPGAIGHLIHVYRNNPAKSTWLAPSTRPRLPWKSQQQKALAALVILSRDHPQKVDPFFAELLRGPRRGNMLVPLLGYAGPRYLATLTNLMSTSDRRYTADTLKSLSRLGTNAWMAPRQYLSIRANWPGNLLMPFPDTETLRRFGKLPESEIRLLLGFLDHTNKTVQELTVHILSRLPENRARIRPVILRLAVQPPERDTDIGKSAAIALTNLETPAEQAVPILLRRLERAIGAHLRELQFLKNDHQDHVTDYLSALSHYDAEATNALKLIESKILVPHVSRAMQSIVLFANSEQMLTKLRPELNNIAGGTWRLLGAYEKQGNEITFGDLGLIDWLGDPTRDVIDLNDPKEIELILGLGKSSIPFLTTEFLLTQSVPARSSEVFALNGRRVPPARRPAYQQRLMTVLAVLGRRHAHEIDRFIVMGSTSGRDVPWEAMMNPADLNVFTNAPDMESGLLLLASRKPIEGYDVGKRIAQYFAKFLPKNERSRAAILNRLASEPIREDDLLLSELVPLVEALGRFGTDPGIIPLVDRKVTDPLRQRLAAPKASAETKQLIKHQLRLLRYFISDLDPPPSP